MKLLYATGNEAKLLGMRDWTADLGVELIGLRDMHCPVPEVEEDGATVLENARKKAHIYYDAFRIPLFSCDTALYFENVPDEYQPGVHARRVCGVNASDERRQAYYAELARKFGDLRAYYQHAICLILDEEHIYEEAPPVLESERFLITSTPHPKGMIRNGFPLDCLSKELKSGKYFYDLEESPEDRLAGNKEFHTFFEKILKEK